MFYGKLGGNLEFFRFLILTNFFEVDLYVVDNQTIICCLTRCFECLSVNVCEDFEPDSELLAIDGKPIYDLRRSGKRLRIYP